MGKLGTTLALSASVLHHSAFLPTWTSWGCSTALMSGYRPSRWNSAPASWTGSLIKLERTLYWRPMTVRRVEYQVQRVRLGRHLSRNAVRQLLTDHAEY